MIELTSGDLAPYYYELSQLAGRDMTLPLSQIVLRPDALDDLVAIAGAGPGTPVIIAQDGVEIRRREVPIKPLVQALFADAGCQVKSITLGDSVPGSLHTEPGPIAEVQAELVPGAVVVALGSGVIADITKHAVHGFEEATGERLKLIVAQTANSVCAFTSGMAVVTIDGVKRTLPSRLPDILVLDSQVLADAPREYSVGGIGDASVSAVAFADYRLSYLLGLSKWEPMSWEVMAFSRTRFLACDQVLADTASLGAGATAIDLSACGFAMTVAGESAPLSGLEHVSSHTLDMVAEVQKRPVGSHGSQCALSSILSLIAWEKLLELPELPDFDPAEIDVDLWREEVKAAFYWVDDTGAAWQECWSDFSTKIKAWHDHADGIRGVTGQWASASRGLRTYVTPPAEFVAALAAAGHPLRWEDIPTDLTEAQARWAFTNAHLMRKRTCVADVLAFAGLWDEEFIDEVFETYRDLIAQHN